MRFDSPSECCRGAPPERLSSSCRRLSTALGHVSPGVLSPYDAVRSRRPVPTAADSTDRVRRGTPLPRPVPPPGFLSPSAVSAATPRSTRVAPCPLETSLDPQLCGLVSCRKRPWGSPFRAFPSRGAVPPSGGPCFPAGSVATSGTARECSGCRGRFPPSADREPRGRAPKSPTSATTRSGTRLPATVHGPPVLHASCPARRPRRVA